MKNGDFYDGEFKDDVKHGAGVFHYAQGSYLTGRWKDDRKHGKMVYTELTKDKVVGVRQEVWYNGELISCSQDQSEEVIEASLEGSETVLELPIKYDELCILEKLGSGGYADVFKAKWNGTTVAVKQFWPKT